MRPAVEAALAVAREGVAADPPVLPPPALRRYLGFTKLSGPALAVIARVVDGDDEFRARVAEAVEPEAVGPAGMLWLTRPVGWAEQLAEIEAEDQAAAAADAEEREERGARRKLVAAQAAAERAAAHARKRDAKLDDMRGELAAERARRVAAEKRLGEMEAALADREVAQRSLAQELADAEKRIAELEVTVDHLQAAATAAQPGQGAPRPGAGDADADADAAQQVALAAIRDAVLAVSRRADELADALKELEATTLDEQLTGGATGPVAGAAVEAPGAEAVTLRRRRVSLPPGVRDDSVDAVDHLLRVPGMLLLVDGYNVSMVGWPELPVHEQRKRLLTALEEKALRTGTPIEAVFDGAEVDTVGVQRHGRQLLRVRFSPPGVEADDVVLDLVAQLPPRRPVTVASSDNRVREGAWAQGANLIHARQLVAALRR